VNAGVGWIVRHAPLDAMAIVARVPRLLRRRQSGLRMEWSDLRVLTSQTSGDGAETRPVGNLEYRVGTRLGI
jgi:hypothetical protein